MRGNILSTFGISSAKQWERRKGISPLTAKSLETPWICCLFKQCTHEAELPTRVSCFAYWTLPPLGYRSSHHTPGSLDLCRGLRLFPPSESINQLQKSGHKLSSESSIQHVALWNWFTNAWTNLVWDNSKVCVLSWVFPQGIKLQSPSTVSGQTQQIPLTCG